MFDKSDPSVRSPVLSPIITAFTVPTGNAVAPVSLMSIWILSIRVGFVNVGAIWVMMVGNLSKICVVADAPVE